MDLTATDSRRQFTLTRTEAGWRVDGGERPEFFVAGDAGVTVVTGAGVHRFGEAPQPPASTFAEMLAATERTTERLLPLTPDAPEIESPWLEVQVGDSPVTAVADVDGGRVAAGDADGGVAVFDANGAQRASAAFESEILSLHFVGDDLVVGEDRGALTRLGPGGAVRWQVEMPYEPMPWDYWSEYRSRVREITSADINDDGEEEILLSNSDRRIWAFSADGQRLWRAPVQWGIFTAVTAGSYRGQFALMGGTARPSIHGRCMVFDAEGSRTAALTRPDLASWSVPSQFRDMRQVDLDGDGAPEVLTAVDTNCRQLVVYRHNGDVMWDADMAGPAASIGVHNTGDGPPVVFCAGGSGYVAAFDGTTGDRLWACYVGEEVALLALTRGGAIAAASPSGGIFLLSPQGALEGRVSAGAELTAFMRPGDHRGGDRLLVGTADGRVVIGR